MNHLSRHNLLSDSQFGFIKNRSTILQLLTVMEDWTDALDNNLQVHTLYLNFKNAFDCVPHKRLVKKLEGYGRKGSLLLLLKETRSVAMNIFQKKYFLFKSFVKIELSYVFTINMFSTAESCMQQ